MKPAILLPRGLRTPGYFFLTAGLLMLTARFYYGLKPEILSIKMFAVYSVYLEEKYMTVITNQFGEEIGELLLLTGLVAIAFTREREETELLSALRLRAFFLSTYINVVLTILAIIFTFGLGFVFVMILSPIMWLATYVVVFRSLVYKTRSSGKEQ